MGSDEVVTRRFLAESVSFVVRCPSRSIRETVEAAFVDLPTGDLAASPSIIELQVDHQGQFTVSVDEQLRFGPQSPNEALGSIVTSATRIALDSDPSRLHLHCAAVTWEQRGMLVTAASGTGKTTLTAALLARGWAYGSDESVALDHRAGLVSTFPKPLMLKGRADDLLPGIRNARVVIDPSDDSLWTVPASALGAEIVDAIRPVCIVVLTREREDPHGEPSTPRKIHPADAVVELMRQTMDSGRYGSAAVEVLAELTATTHCVKMRIGPLGPGVERLRAILEVDPTHHRVHELRRVVAGTTPGWHVPEHVRSIIIGGRAVVHDTAGGMIVALDEAGTALWSALHGQPPTGWPRELLHDPSTLEFLNDLAAFGLVHAGEAPRAQAT